ncbi:phage portal protein, lambda [Roseivivax marinus]|uniref:Phage portal protein, lambda n=1 Tax=Roseivivax marinus TaxID=1379903 RepID=W4HF55_9RHOB|nr:phage portal protein [Roseivivax marinus]ETW10625.1 phage portal protein, lambda [Roseivivax marinus]
MTQLLDHRGKPVHTRVAKPTARYMNHDRTGLLSMRRATTRDVKHDVRSATRRAFALAFDFMQNSGWIAGAADQIIADMIGPELRLNCRPDLSQLGYDEKERAQWCRMVEAEWRRWSWNPWECDLEGKSTVQEILDGTARYYLAGGEALATIDYLGRGARRRYGLRTGTKARLVSPHRLEAWSSPVEGWDQGILHDEIGRPMAYRFRRDEGGIDRSVDVPARAGALMQVIHVMDRGATPNSPRGISPMTPAFKVIAQSDQLADATLTTALLQTTFAATIKSPEPTEAAFAALEQITGVDGLEGSKELAEDLFAVWQQRLDALKTKSLSIGGDSSQVNHLGPGEELELHSSATPGPQYEPFQKGLLREMARCLGVTAESLTMDHSGASYSSTRMAVASIWPTILRRRERIVAPMAQGLYEAWLDEQIGMGAIPFKGGYQAFAANRERVVDAEWRGPARPSADPYKDALANKVRLETGQTTLKAICAEAGEDWEEVADQAQREVERFGEIGIVPPHGRMSGGEGAGPNGAAAEGMREPANGN